MASRSLLVSLACCGDKPDGIANVPEALPAARVTDELNRPWRPALKSGQRTVERVQLGRATNKG